MKFDPQNEEDSKEYLPFACQYGVVQSQEPDSNTHNGVFYNKDKFSEASIECLQKAYTDGLQVENSKIMSELES